MGNDIVVVKEALNTIVNVGKEFS
jgi:hypothetical protein